MGRVRAGTGLTTEEPQPGPRLLDGPAWSVEITWLVIDAAGRNCVPEGMAKRQRHHTDKPAASRVQSAADRNNDPALKEAARRMQSVADKREHRRGASPYGEAPSKA